MFCQKQAKYFCLSFSHFRCNSKRAIFAKLAMRLTATRLPSLNKELKKSSVYHCKRGDISSNWVILQSQQLLKWSIDTNGGNVTNLRTLLSLGCWLVVLMFMISRCLCSHSMANKMLFLELSLSSEVLTVLGRPGNRPGLAVGLTSWLEDSELFSDSGLEFRSEKFWVWIWIQICLPLCF